MSSLGDEQEGCDRCVVCRGEEFCPVLETIEVGRYWKGWDASCMVGSGHSVLTEATSGGCRKGMRWSLGSMQACSVTGQMGGDEEMRR